MRSNAILVTTCGLIAGFATPTLGQRAGGQASPAQVEPAADSTRVLVGRLDLDRYKATIKGLTQFGDRRQGTDRNRRAIDWIEAQLKSYGCMNTERITYEYQPAPTGQGRGGATGAATGQRANAGGRGGTGLAQGGGRPRGFRHPTGVNTDPLKQPDLTLPASAGRKGTTHGTHKLVRTTKRNIR